MSKSRMKSDKNRSDKLNTDDLKRPPIHPVKSLYPTDELENEDLPLYPMDELENEDFEESPVENRSPRKNVSETESDSSPKTKAIDRGHEQSYSESPPPKIKEETNFWKLLIAIIIAIAGVIIIVISSVFPGMSMPFSSEKKQLDIDAVMSSMRQHFTDQPEYTFRIVSTVIKRTESGKSSAPGIIILLASQEAKDIRNRFALHLAKSISQSSDYISIKSNSFRTPEELKKDIDVNIKSNLTRDALQAVLVDGIDLIPFEAAMIFHSYCDHENAPFKKAIYVMTMSSDERIAPKSDMKTWDGLAMKRLKDAWKNGGEDQVSSLISRLTVTVAAIIGKT